MARQPHLRVDEGDVADLALLPGDPDRVDRIAGHCDAAETVAENREYRVVNATYGGRELTIASTGIGAPSAAIAVEELAATGVDTFLRVGTTGALQPGVEVGDMVVLTGAAKDEGTTRRYEDVSVPAVATHGVVDALVGVAAERDEALHVGPGVTDDAFYAEDDAAVDRWSSASLLCVEMEAAAIFSLARRRGLAAGAICTVDGNLVTGTQKGERDEDELPPKARDNVGRAIDLALAATTRL
ncbi:MAG: nucleoside phosphorylase [Halobacteriaceae archaeon]